PEAAEGGSERGNDGKTEWAQPHVHIQPNVMVEVDAADIPEDEDEDEEQEKGNHHPSVGTQPQDRQGLTSLSASRVSRVSSVSWEVSRPRCRRSSSPRSSNRTPPPCPIGPRRRRSRPSMRAPSPWRPGESVWGISRAAVAG